MRIRVRAAAAAAAAAAETVGASTHRGGVTLARRADSRHLGPIRKHETDSLRGNVWRR